MKKYTAHFIVIEEGKLIDKAEIEEKYSLKRLRVFCENLAKEYAEESGGKQLYYNILEN